MIRPLIFLCVFVATANSDFSKPTCQSDGWSCKDCKNRKFCLFNNVWSTAACSNPVSGVEKIYCNPKTNECQAAVPPECDKSAEEFKCPRPGNFPNLRDCTRYIKCEADQTNVVVPKSVACPESRIYNHTFGKCLLKVSSADCKPISACPLSTAHGYPSDESLYYACLQTGPTLKVCEPSKFYNPSGGVCEYKCPGSTGSSGSTGSPGPSVSSGPWANTRNCNAYFTCKGDDQRTLSEITCPTGEGFDPRTKRCASGYDKMCNEYAVLQNTINRLPKALSVVINTILDVLSRLKLNPLKMILDLGGKEQDVSDGLLILQHMILNQKIPAPAIDFFLQFLPANLRTIAEQILKTLLPFLPIQPVIDAGKPILNQLLLSQFGNIDLRPIMDGSEMLDGFDLSKLMKPLDQLNTYLGWDVFEVVDDRVKVNEEELVAYLHRLTQYLYGGGA